MTLKRKEKIEKWVAIACALAFFLYLALNGLLVRLFNKVNW